MIQIDIKPIVKPLDLAGIKYETQVILIEHVNRDDGSPIERHKHIRIFKESVIDRKFIKDQDNIWYEGECSICN